MGYLEQSNPRNHSLFSKDTKNSLDEDRCGFSSMDEKKKIELKNERKRGSQLSEFEVARSVSGIIGDIFSLQSRGKEGNGGPLEFSRKDKHNMDL